MLKEILNIIKKMGYISRSQIANNLNITEDLVDRGISQLVRMGYILEEKQIDDCSSSCGSCPYAKACNKTIVKSFQISEKGSTFLMK